MKFGVFDHLDRREAPIAELYAERLDFAEACDAAGFYAYQIAEHHMTKLGMAPSPLVYLGALSQRTKHMKIGALTHLLPLYEPLRLIEEIGMMDHLSNGRLQLGIGRGISPYETGYFGITPQEGKIRYREIIKILLAGMQNDRLNYETERYKFYDVPMEQRPLQNPYPPLWVGAHHPESLNSAAEHGCNVVVGGPNAHVRKAVDYYPEAWEKYKDSEVRQNSPVKDPFIGGWRLIYLAETEEEAHRVGKPAFELHMDHLASLWKAWGGAPGVYVESYEKALASGTYVVGTPDQMRERLGGDIDAMAVNYMLFSMCWGSMSHEESMRSLALFRDEVMPHFVDVPTAKAAE